MGKIASAFRGISLPEQQKRQVLALDQEFSDLEAQVQSLKAENQHLQAEVNPLKHEVDRLKQQVEEMQNKSTAHDDDLDEKATALLKAIADSDGRMPKYATGRHFGLTHAQVNYYFSLLSRRHFIMQSTAMTDPGYRAAELGLEYLHEKGLL